MPAYKYQTNDGKALWYCSFHYKDWLGQNKRKKKMGFATRKAALEWERTFLDRESKNPDLLFSSFIENYMKDCENRMKPTTLASKKFMQESKILPFFGQVKLSKIDPLMVRRWQNELLDYRDENSKPYSKTYLRTLHAEFSAIMNYAVRYYGLPSNPCHVTGSIGKSKAKEMSIWSRDQFEHFITFEKRKAFHCAFNILYYTGMREGELLALTPADIPRDDLIIQINKNYEVVEGKEMLLTPKSEKSNRIITIHERLHKEILEYIDGMCIEKDERIFYFESAGLRQEFKRATKRAGLPPIRIHDLRHSHASLLIEMGVPITEISKRLGHENIETTLRVYSHLYPGKERNIPDLITAFFESESVENMDSSE
ncbi:MAG: site-specific integrase [Lachnospiraceae bacterium]|nr:site-specific integrase [Lachnospiraceae bacterium]